MEIRLPRFSTGCFVSSKKRKRKKDETGESRIDLTIPQRGTSYEEEDELRPTDTLARKRIRRYLSPTPPLLVHSETCLSFRTWHILPPWHILCQSLFRARRSFPFFVPSRGLRHLAFLFPSRTAAVPFNSSLSSAWFRSTLSGSHASSHPFYRDSRKIFPSSSFPCEAFNLRRFISRLSYYFSSPSSRRIFDARHPSQSSTFSSFPSFFAHSTLIPLARLRVPLDPRIFFTSSLSFSFLLTSCDATHIENLLSQNCDIFSVSSIFMCNLGKTNNKFVAAQ